MTPTFGRKRQKWTQPGHGVAVSLLVLLPATFACADEAGLETIEVTGTRISRPDFESASPIVTIPATALTSTSAITVERALEQYPQFVPVAGASSNNPGNDGQSNVSLRGLGVNRTLVLLDGRRLMPADGNGSVDLNILPPALIESVEVMTGGASAAYGSDAIAGVVNVRLRQQYTGVQVEGAGSISGEGDGSTYSAGITAGTTYAGGRGTLSGYVGYAQRDAVMQSDRAFSRIPLEYFEGSTGGRGPGGAFLPSGDGSGQEGIHIVFADRAVFNEVFSRYGYAPGSINPQQGFGVNEDGTLFTIGTGAAGSVINYRGVRDPVMYNDRSYAPYNYAGDTALLMPLERKSAFVRGTYAASDRAELYAQALYADYTVQRRLLPARVGIALVPPTNPYMPADLADLLASRQDPTAPYRYFRLLPEAGLQRARNDRAVLQLTAGVRGEIFPGWSYDAYVQYGANDRDEYQTNNVSLSRFQELAFAADGGASICAGGLNPFRATPLSPECIDYVVFDASNHVELRQTLGEVSVSGPLGSLPAGDVSLAAGVFYKRDEFDFNADPAVSAVLPAVEPGVIGPRPDVSGFPGVPDRSGNVSNTDLYAELHVPLLRDLPGVAALELGLGWRYSDYSQAGAANSYKAELQYRPVASVRVRGSFQHAVRAPSIEELYFPPLANQFEIPRPDPCDADRSQIRRDFPAQVQALCLAQGVPAAAYPGFNFELRRTNGVSGGNPDLQPEQADTTTVGVVYTHDAQGDHARDLQLSLDWYRIEIEDGIGRWDAKSAVERCFDPAYNPDFDPANVYCSFFTRDAETGFIFANIIDRNIGGLRTSGIDTQLDWGYQFGAGTLGINALVSYVDTWEYADPSGGTIEYAGTVGGGGLGRSLPRWKSLLSLSFTADDGWDALARWRYIDGSRDISTVLDTIPGVFRVPARQYVDVAGGHAFAEGSALHGLSLRGGIDNVFAQRPPIFPSWQQANTDPSQYDVLGRSYYLQARYAFR